jgi:hypothetical protein
MSEFLWDRKFLKIFGRHPNQPLSGRINSFKSHNQAWSIVVKQEMLFQANIIDDITFASIYLARKARNRLVHKGDNIDSTIVHNLFYGVCKMLSLCAEIIDVPLSNLDVSQAIQEQMEAGKLIDNLSERCLSQPKK